MAERIKNLVILISGRGSNMQALVQACHAEGWPARIAAVITSRTDASASGLAFARSQGITTAVVNTSEYADRASYDQALIAVIERLAPDPDLILLAGFMRVLTERFVHRYAGRLLNIHPSLLPSFPGLNTHQRALAAGVKLHGATVHFVTPALDHGPIVIQSAVPVMAKDDAATLAQRVLATEHIIYPRAVRWFVNGQLALDGQRVILTAPEPQWLFLESVPEAISYK